MMVHSIIDEDEFQKIVDVAVEKAFSKLSQDFKSNCTKSEIIDGKELMKRLAVSEPTLIRWRKKGKIPFMEIGSSIRYDWFKVIEAIEVNSKTNKRYY